MLDLARVPEDYRMRRDIAVYERIGGDHHIITDENSPDDSGIHAYPHSAAYGRAALTWATVLLTDSHALVDIAVVTYRGVRVNRDAVRMADIQALSDFTSA